MADVRDAPAGPHVHLWSRDGFLGSKALAVRPAYTPTYFSVTGPHAPHRLNVFDIDADDAEDAEALPTPILTSRTGIAIALTRRKQLMPFTFRNAEADELYFVQSGSARFVTDFGTIDAAELDFVFLPRAVSYRIEPLDDRFVGVILESPEPLAFESGLPNGMIDIATAVRTPTITQPEIVPAGRHRLFIKSFDGITRYEMAHDPLQAVRLMGGETPVWAMNLRAVNPSPQPPRKGPPAHFLTTPDTGIRSFSLSARVAERPPIHHNADYDEIILFAAGPGAWGSISEPGTLTWVPKAVTHHGPVENVPEGYQAWLIEIRPTLRLTPAAAPHAALIETGEYGPL